MIPTKPKYVPNQRPLQQAFSSRPKGVPGQTERSHKVIISRFLLVNGHISFVVGTQLDGVVTRDADEVPVAKILDHVSPAELERFENQDFFDEDERERLLPPRKPRGRPPKSGGIVPSFNIAPVGEETSREQSLLPDGSISLKKKVGRPKGWKKGGKYTSADPSIPAEGRIANFFKRDPSDKKADRLTSKKQSLLAEASTGIKKARGRPPRQKNLSVVIPSFNGPQPQKFENIPDAESESDEMLLDPKPQYSMITASGLGQSDTEDMTSREQSIELVPASSSKKRPLNTSSAFLDRNSISNAYNDERSPHPSKRVKTLSETSPDPIADDSAALLRQFQARVYGPDDSAKSSTIPHRQSRTSLTLDDSAALLRQFHAHTHSSSSASSSSDSLMGPTPRPHKPSPAQLKPSNPLPGEPSVPQHPSPKKDSARNPTSHLNKSITISNPSQRPPAKAPPNKSVSSSTHRKVSLTPHFPPRSTSLSHNPMNGSAESKPPSHLSSVSRPAPSQPIKTTFSRSSRTIPSPPKKKKQSPPTPRPSAPSQSSQASTSSKIGFAGIPPAKDLTDYFAPKTTTAKTLPIQRPHSPTSQLLGPNDSESEDQLARKSSSDSLGSEIVAIPRNRNPHPLNSQARQSTSDSLGSEIIAIPLNRDSHPPDHQGRQSSFSDSLGSEIIAKPLPRNPNPHPHPPTNPALTTTTTTTTIAAAIPTLPPPSPQPNPTASSSSSSSSSASSNDDTIYITRPAAPVPASAHSTVIQTQRSADALNKAFEIDEEEEEEEEESSSESESEDDSMGSEVMIVRPG